jgi:hypothetical protein
VLRVEFILFCKSLLEIEPSLTEDPEPDCADSDSFTSST